MFLPYKPLFQYFIPYYVCLNKSQTTFVTSAPTRAYTQEDFAKLLAMSTSGYAKLERGEVDIPITRLEQIAKEFDVKPTDLINVGGGSTSIIFNITNSPAGGNNQSTIYVTADVQHLFTQMAGLYNTIAELQARMEKMEKSR